MHLQIKTASPTRTSRLLLAIAVSALTAPVAAQPSESVPIRPPTVAGPDADADSGKLQPLRRARDAMIGARDFAAALTPAQAAVAEQASAPDAKYADDIVMLARIQAELGDRDAAEANYVKAIGLIEAAEGEYSITLVDPYRGLGRTYIKGARYPEAIAALEQAQHISQRNLGLFNVEQAPLLDDITTAYLGIGDTREAQRKQLERLDNAVKRFGADDPRVFPYRYQLADYYQRSRLPASAREQYAEVLKSQQAQLGATHPGLLSPLRQLVRIDLLTAQTEEPEARTQLATILEQNPDTDAVERGLSLATLGDWAIVANEPEEARAYYNQAWAAMSSNPDVDVATFFATPTMIDFIPPLSSVDRGDRSAPYAWGQVDFTFDVAADGRPFNVATVGELSGPAGEIQNRYSRRLRETHFRPRLVGGEPVPTTNVQLTNYFRFYVTDKKKKEGDDTAGNEG